MITQSREDYLRAFYILQERHGQLKSTDVANYLRVSKPSVSEMVQRLNQEGIIKSAPYSKLTLTAKGKRMAMHVTSKHRIIEAFLSTVLKIEESKVHEEAHRLEHAFSDESVEQMKKMLGNPSVDPHGKPIPPFEIKR